MHPALLYDQITRVGPGTPGGNILRRYWHPVWPSHLLAPGRTRPVRALGENYTLYRGDSGQAYLVDAACPHRLTVLHAGWVEGDSLRCMYHGWKFDHTGQCIEQPAEDAGFARDVRIRSYPVQEYAGLIYVYLGQGEPPPLPCFEEFDNPALEALASVRPPGVWACNWFQTIENDLDPVHTSFVHRDSEPHWHGVPQVSAKEARHGLVVTARRGDWERATWYHFPCLLKLSVFPDPSGPLELPMLLYTLPVDDERCMFLVSLAMAPALAQKVRNGDIVPPGQVPLTPQIISDLFSGDRRPQGITEEDYLIMVGQGVNADRSREKLGRSDAAIVLLRDLWRRAVDARLAESGG